MYHIIQTVAFMGRNPGGNLYAAFMDADTDHISGKRRRYQNRCFLYQKKLDELGKISLEEIRVLIILFAAVVMWFAGEDLSIDSTTVCLICACLLCIPKLGNLTWKDCKNNVSLSVMFVVSGGISLGTAMCATGTATWLARDDF